MSRGLGDVYKRQANYYTNSSHVPVNTDVSLIDKIKIEEQYHSLTPGGHIFHAFMGESYSDPDSLMSLTNKIAKKSDATLFGASTSTPGQPSPIINLRKELDVYANLRPIKSYRGVRSISDNIDFLIVRENTEGLYSQIEYEQDNKVIAQRVITRRASEKIAKVAFEQCIACLLYTSPSPRDTR